MKKEKSIIVANWKMNPQSLAKAKTLFNSVKKEIKNIKNACPVGKPSVPYGVEVVICPPFLYLFEFLSRWRKSQILKLGAQDCFWEQSGAYTGEISPTMLKNLGLEYVIIGHSERRKYLQETDEMINKKIEAALKVGLKPILCIGETENERKKGKTFQVLKKQLKIGLKNTKYKIQNTKYLTVAYEPVWAIGTGRACNPKSAKEVLLFLRKRLKKIPILYGGSVNSKNAADYIKAGFDGLLVGGASLNAKEFIEIVKNVSSC